MTFTNKSISLYGIFKSRISTMTKLLKVVFSLGMAVTVSTVACSEETPPLQHILSCHGDQLYAGDEPFRFVSLNIPNLHLIEDSFSFANPNPWRWPDEYEIVDALESVRQMGGTVVRIYVLSVHREGSDMGDHVHVRGPGDFNEEAFRVLDSVLRIAAKKGIRVIIPLVDNWHWWGGRAEYAQFRGKPKEAFWTDEQVIQDFEETIRFTLSRVNSCTGKPYKDDPAIFGWETGNELDSTPDWTRRIAAHIKSIDPNHLVIDGYSLHGVREASLTDPNIDVITTHHYPNTDKEYVPAILKAHQATAGRKPYFVGEFGFIPVSKTEQVLDTVVKQGISGALLWSLRFHNRDGGFYWHNEPSGENIFKAYHWPGFPSGDDYAETAMLDLTRKSAYRIRQLQPPPVAAPAAPTLLPIEHPGRISWQGSAGADRYDIGRAESESGPWTTVGKNVSDAAVQYRPLFCDATAEHDRTYFYRVIAHSQGGNSKHSNTIGPVSVNHLLLVDEMEDDSLVHSIKGTVRQLGDHPRRTQEDIHRQQLDAGAELVYRTPKPIRSIRAYLFCANATPPCEIAVSADGEAFETVQLERTSADRNAGNYGYLLPVLLECSTLGKNARFVRLNNIARPASIDSNADEHQFQISRIEIAYGERDVQP